MGRLFILLPSALEIELETDEKENKTIKNTKLTLLGNLDEKQRVRLLAVVNSCPVHKMLSNPIVTHTQIG